MINVKSICIGIISEVVDDIDAVKAEMAYNAIKNAVVNKDFSIPVFDSNGTLVV